MFRYSLVLLLGLWATSPAWSASWADGLFDEVSKDFGSVPRGPTLTHPFRLVNKTNDTVVIHHIRVSCNCVAASAARHNLRPGEETTIHVTMDTRRFTGVKTVTVYVQFSQPSTEEVRLWVQANGRDDVAVNPDALTFGRVKRGTTQTATTTITFYGNSAAQITEARSESNYIRPTLKELRREQGEVSYQLTAQLRSDTPVGKWYNDIWLGTNINTMPRVRVPVTVEIESQLSVSPPSLTLGPMKPGTTTERKIIVRGTQPFLITKVSGTDAQLTVKDSTTESKAVHVLTITFSPKQAGDLDRTLRIVTDLKEEGEIEFQARAQVAP